MSTSDFRVAFEDRPLWESYATVLRFPHLRKFVPLVDMLEAKHSSLWWSLSFSQQEELLPLLEQMKPEEQECLLRVMNQLKERRTWSPSLFGYCTHADILLRLLTCLHSIDRLNLLRRLESMDEQEQRMLIDVMDRQKESERVELLGILNEHEALEQQILLIYALDKTSTYQTMMLKVMKNRLPVDRLRLLRLLDGLNMFSQNGLLEVLKHSSHGHELIDRLNLLRLLELMKPQEQENLIRVLGSLSESEQVELLEILDEHEALEQKILLIDVLDRTSIIHVEGLNALHQYRLLKVLAHISRWHELWEMLNRLKPQERLQLIRTLHGLDSPVELSKMVDEILNSPMRMSEMINQLEQQQQQKRVLSTLRYLQRKYNIADHSIDDARLLSKAANLMYLHLPQREGCLSLDLSSLQQGLERLEPLERKQLLRVLKRLNVLALSEQVEILYEEELKGVDVRSMLSRAYVLLTQMEYESLMQHLLLLFVCLLSVYLSEADPQGGFRNLLLDGWWLEFWEIILLAAGDVERNPGPRRMTDKELRKIDARVLGKDALFDVYDAVYDCRPKWRNLCLALRLSPSDLSAIDEKRRGNPDACLQDGLSLWLQGHYNTDTHGPPSWRMLVDAVANSAGGDDHTLALEIAEKHKALPIVPLHEDRRRSEDMSSSFSSMYRPVVRLLRNVDVSEVKECLRYLTDPEHFDKLCVPPRVYKCAATTKDLLDRLCPQYINPGNTFVLEEIVTNFGSRRCKKLVREYINKFM